MHKQTRSAATQAHTGYLIVSLPCSQPGTAERFTPHDQLLSDPTDFSCQENPRRRLCCKMNDALFIFCSLRLLNMPARCFISLKRGSLKVRRSLSETRQSMCEEEAEDRRAAARRPFFSGVLNWLLLSFAIKPHLHTAALAAAWQLSGAARRCATRA